MAPPDVADPRRPCRGLARRCACGRRWSGFGLTVARVDLAGPAASPSAADEARLGALAELPRAVLVRSIPAGSFEQVTLRLGLLHALEALGVAVVNTAARDRALRRQVDDQLPAGPGQACRPRRPGSWSNPTPRACWCEQAAARGERLVLKPLFGAQGRGLRLLLRVRTSCRPRRRSAASTTCSASCAGHEDGWRDFRVFVVGRRAVAAMARRGAGLDHQHRPGRRARARPRRGPAGRAGRRGGRCGRRRPRRRRPDRGRAWPAADPRGQQHAGLAGAAERVRASTSPPSWPPYLADRVAG